MRRVLVVAISLVLGLAVLAPASAAGSGTADWLAQQRTWVMNLDTGEPVKVAGHTREGKFSTTAPSGYSPSQVRRAYGFDRVASDGAGQVIGIVSAYDAPNAAADLAAFISQYRLPSMYGLPATGACTVANGPHPCFEKVYAKGKRPRADSGWALESALDVQWAHAIAPGADILLVEASTNRADHLLQGVDAAVARGAKVVSMSWGGGETEGVSAFNRYFSRTGVTFVAASGDGGTGPIYPATSPYVVAVGGTSLFLDQNGNLTAPERAWTGSGGGLSLYEPVPGYQASYPIPASGGMRGSPDVSYAADPETGFSVYSSTKYFGQSGWFKVGGTSAGAPQWAALIALANQGRTGGSLSSNDLADSPVYSSATGRMYSSNFRDITTGSNGACSTVCSAGAGYDFVTGLGSPLAASLVSDLQRHR